VDGEVIRTIPVVHSGDTSGGIASCQQVVSWHWAWLAPVRKRDGERCSFFFIVHL
jgi:hypothetical protein